MNTLLIIVMMLATISQVGAKETEDSRMARRFKYVSYDTLVYAVYVCVCVCLRAYACECDYVCVCVCVCRCVCAHYSDFTTRLHEYVALLPMCVYIYVCYALYITICIIH